MSDQVEASKAKPGRKKGARKTGGRKKGTPNRNSLSVLGALDRAGCPVIEFLVADIQTLEPQQRIGHWMALMGFCYPRLKEIDPTSAVPPPPAPEDKMSPVRALSNADLLSLVRKPPEQKANA